MLKRNLLSVLSVAILSVGLVACGGEATDTTNNSENDTTNSTVDTTAGTDEEPMPEDKSTRVSPPMQSTGMIGDAEVIVDYSQPSVKGRKVWGGLVPYGEIWRTGANEATWFETSKDISVGEEILPAGRYSLFTIPNETEWTLIFNSQWEQWGAYDYDSTYDVTRVRVTPELLDNPSEMMTMTIDNGLTFAWDSLTFVLPMVTVTE